MMNLEAVAAATAFVGLSEYGSFIAGPRGENHRTWGKGNDQMQVHGDGVDRRLVAAECCGNR